MRTRTRTYETQSIGDHAALIHDAVVKSLRDGQTRRLAGAIVAGSYDWVPDPRGGGRKIPTVRYHGRYYRVVPPGQSAPAGCPPRQDECAVVAVWNFWVLNVRYTDDMEHADTYQDLRTTLESGIGDCDDFTVGICALLQGLGYNCAARIISVDGQKWQHVYPMVEMDDGGWIAMDATEDGKYPGWQYPNIKVYRDFDMSTP